MLEKSTTIENIGPLRDSIQVIDPNGVLEKIRAENLEGKYSLFCANHVLSRRRRLGTLILDFLMTKRCLNKQWISLIPIGMANHGGSNMIGKIKNSLCSALIQSCGWIPICTAAWKASPHERPLEEVRNNAKRLKSIEQKKSNVWISPYENTHMYKAGKQNFTFDALPEGKKKPRTILGNSFAREARFPGMNIVPIYIYEHTVGQYYMAVGTPIERMWKKVLEIELAYLQSMQELKDQTLELIADKKPTQFL